MHRFCSSNVLYSVRLSIGILLHTLESEIEGKDANKQGWWQGRVEWIWNCDKEYRGYLVQLITINQQS